LFQTYLFDHEQALVAVRPERLNALSRTRAVRHSSAGGSKVTRSAMAFRMVVSAHGPRFSVGFGVDDASVKLISGAPAAAEADEESSAEGEVAEEAETEELEEEEEEDLRGGGVSNITCNNSSSSNCPDPLRYECERIRRVTETYGTGAGHNERCQQLIALLLHLRLDDWRRRRTATRRRGRLRGRQKHRRR
jgi:hypothetical protein